jgi:TolB-like protein
MPAMRAPRLRLVVALCAAVALPAAAHAKPKVAVLGLEVVDQGGVDPKTTAAARALTKELRDEASKDSGKFELAPDSSKDLLELKLLSDCSDEGRRCMADIGKELKAEFLLYGKIEKQKNGYLVTLKLLDTATAQMAKTTSDVVPFAESTGRGAATWGRSFYARLTGAPEEGALVVRANVESGSVYVDGELATNLADGTAKITGLTEGVHRVTVEAGGYVRYDAEVAIVAGRQEELVVTLRAERDGGTPGTSRPGAGWRTAFWVAAGATAVGATAWTVEAYRYSGLWVTTGPLKQDHLDAVGELNVLLPAGEQLDPATDACKGAEPYRSNGDAPIRDAAGRVVDACDRGQFHANVTMALGVATGVTAAAAAFFYYKGYVQPRASTSRERQAAKRPTRRARPSAVRFSPTISPTTVGAGLAIEF